MIMEKVVDFMDTEFAKDVLNSDEKIVFNKPCRASKNNNVKNTSTKKNMKKQKNSTYLVKQSMFASMIKYILITIILAGSLVTVTYQNK